MSIYIEKETEATLDFDFEQLINDVILYTEDFEGLDYEAEVNVILTDNEGICEVNRECRGIDAPTDVLSFPMLDYEAAGDFGVIHEEDDSQFNPDTGELLLGDIMISLDRVKSQAEESGHSRQREMAFLIVHSMLHLFGYDHIAEDERELMEEKQRSILDGLNITR